MKSRRKKTMFHLTEKEKRKGIIHTKNGEIETPFFMPDATRGFVRSMSRVDLENIEVGPMVVNTYHLYLQPGIEIVKKAGGIHEFMNWKAPLLSDSGGYQIFSLIHKNPKLGKITDEEAIFRSPLNGSLQRISPEKSIEIQFDLGVDMMVVLDDVPPNSYSQEEIEKAVKRTVKWADRCKTEYEKQLKKRKIAEKEKPLLFGVIQGGPYRELRKYCADELKKIDFDGYGFGARHIDAEGNFMEEMVEETAQMIPDDKLRFALGVGTPDDIRKFHAYGWDMFDCVIPTREGRHGRLFLKKIEVEKKEKLFYQTININNEKFKNDFSPVDENCDCLLCRNYTRAYLRHMFSVGDPLAARLASMHNLRFYMKMMEGLRRS